ncbi:hypothetical protein HOLleu_27423 [Holothuria leucospilota]|uniref:Secreted protein n=1 Tax=Holothuria leucospilota TaxID=206669 RepID=A0A9Q1H0U3_HOLLE|nr:hypothetical protein HOLleu_27423 [Holothuria leucospilota]
MAPRRMLILVITVAITMSCLADACESSEHAIYHPVTGQHVGCEICLCVGEPPVRQCHESENTQLCKINEEKRDPVWCGSRC